ncbi:WAS protein family [Acrasis kona]|uniref:WAS protein family n=1 Tax=Acrasis kona TaxID=1008807 RepID=A0AAW2ZMA2_9EUKA
MVVTKRPLAHYDTLGLRNGGNELITTGHICGKTLQGSAMNSMNGMLFQLSSLSLIAREIFDGILAQSVETFERVNKLKERIQTASVKLTEAEEYTKNNNDKLLLTTSGYHFGEESRRILNKEDSQMIQRGNQPPALGWQYETNCVALPQFSPELNELDTKKQCIRVYSNPKFFFEKWAENEIAKQNKEAREAREKRKKKPKSHPKKSRKVEKISLHHQKYNKDGELILTPGTESSVTPNPNQNSSDEYIAPPPGPPPDMDDDNFIPPPPERSYSVEMSQMNGSSIPPPPPGPPPPMGAPANKIPAAPAAPPAGGGFVPPPPPGPPPPPPMSGFAPPPPPPAGGPPVAAQSSGASLHDMISAGVALKKREQVEQPKTMSLLEQIRQGKELKKASERKVPEPVKAADPEPTSVADILSKKFASVVNDDSDDEDDDDWDD